MREVRNITVAVTPELYRQTRKLAAEMDSTVTAMVAYLLERFPSALKAAGYKVTAPSRGSRSLPGGRPHGAAPAPVCPTCGRIAPPASFTPGKNANSDCTAVKSSQPTNFSATSEAHADENTAAVHKYDGRNSSVAGILRAEITKAYSGCTPVEQQWFRKLISRKKKP